MSERSAWGSGGWGLWLLAWVLLTACATPPERALAGGVPDASERVLLGGKRFKPGKSKSTTQPSKPAGTGSTAAAPRESQRAVRVTAPSYKLGESDGGPGQWEKAPIRPKGAGYQKEVTGAPEGVEYAVPARGPTGKVLFDGYKDGKLLDAKDWEQWPPADTEFWQRGVREDALRQLDAARGTPIEWHFPNEDKARTVREFLKQEAINGIDVKVTRKKN